MVLGLGVVLGLQFIDVGEMLVTVAGAGNKEIGYNAVIAWISTYLC